MGESVLQAKSKKIKCRFFQNEGSTLRERLLHTGPHIGCETSHCGACTEDVDGMSLKSCTVLSVQCEGADMLTVEGLEQGGVLHAIQQAFHEEHGLQCGFCTPGIVLRTKWLTDQNRALTRAEIARALDGHLCRCTGYVKIIDAIELYAKARRGEPLPEPTTDAGLGKPYPRYKGEQMTLGDRPYVADMVREGMLHGALVLSPHARAKVTRIDRGAASGPD